jgi:hypothetical protein
MKTIALTLIALGAISTASAQVYAGTEKGTKVHFFSKTAMKDIEATNAFAKPFLKTETGEFIVKLQNKAFRFENSFMQEHFNENYMESEKFPFTTFMGKINEKVDYKKDGEYKVTCTGKMDMHS